MKFLDLQGLSGFLDKLKTIFPEINHKHNINEIEDYEVDSALSSTSTNAIQNKVVESEIKKLEDKKADKENIPTKTSDLTNDSNFITQNILNEHNVSADAHNDIRSLISSLTTQVENFLDVDDTTKDQLSEVIALIENNEDLIDAITTGKINVSDIVNDLVTNDSKKVLSAAQGVVLKSLIDTIEEELENVNDVITNQVPGSVKYSESQELTDEQKETARTNIGIGEASDVKFNNLLVNSLTMKDSVTGIDYIISIENGIFVYHCKLVSIEIAKAPDVMEYFEGDELDSSMVVVATYENGQTSEITDYYVDELVSGNTSVEISYTENGITCTTTLYGITVKGVEGLLTDFYYTDNGDGTYTITDWKGTYNGVESTELHVPNSSKIIL